MANGGGVISIRNQDGTEFVNCTADGAFWGMRLKKIAPEIANLPPVVNLACDPEQDDGGGHRNVDKNASDLTLNSAKLTCVSAQHKLNPGKIRFEWQGIDLGTENAVLDVWAEATLQPDGDFCYFDGGFENRSKFYTVYYFELPRISGLGAINDKPENDFWALPFYNGRLIKNPVEKGLLGKNHQFAANVSGHSMQFDALYNEENGLYLGTFDPEQTVKRYTLDSNGQGVAWAILNVPDNMRQVPQKWTIPYSSGIRVFHGDWYDACQIYRQWALQQPWTQGGPLTANKNISPIFRDADDSIAVSSAMIDNTEPGYTRKFLETYKDYKIIVWLTHWGLDNTRFDGPNPDRFPLTELDQRAIAYLKERKIPIRPYIQCTEWDSGTPSFKAHADAENNIVCNYYGQRIRWGARKGSTTHRYIAYPGALWRSVLGETVEKMAASGFDGAYMDSGNHGGMYMNFTPACSNSTGGGADYVKNNQRLLSEIRERTRKINPNFSVDAESFWEGNIAVLDGFLVCNTTNAYLEAERVTAVPLVQTVYHDYTVMYSFWPSGSDVARDNALPYAAKLGLAYTWGVKPGLTLPQLDWKFGNEQEIQRIHKNRFEGYAKTKKYLIYGQLLRMPPVTGRTQVPVKWHRSYSANYYAIFMDSVLCTAWRMINGDFALAMYNITETPAEVTIRLNKKEYLLDDSAFSAMHPADLKFEQTADDADILLKLTVPSRMPTMLEHLKK